MSILNTITQSTGTEGVRIVIAGNEKVGKTTLASQAPRPLLIPLEIGYSGVSVQKTAMLQTFQQVNQLIDEICGYAQQGNFPFKSLIFDSATALERMVHQAVIESDPNAANGNPKGIIIDNALGGYGKGHTRANDFFNNFLKKCDYLAVTFNINIILTCHVFAAKLIDPNSGEYDSWDLLLHSPKNQKSYGKREMVTQWADIIGFLYEPIYITKGENVNIGVSAQKGRVLGLERTPSYTAGNRYGVGGEIPIPLEQGWNHLAKAVYDHSGVDIYNRDGT